MNLIENGLLQTAEWRREKAQEFPDDHRNLAAAELLEKLATGADDIRGTDLERRYFNAWEGEDGYSASEAESDTLKAIGFQSFPGSATEFFDGLVEKLEDLN